MYDFEYWRQRQKELLREAEMARLAKIVRSNRKRKSQQSAPLKKTPKCYGNVLAKLLRALKYAIQK